MSKNSRLNLYVLFLSFFFFAIKWFFEFSIFFDEDITFKIIAASISDSYFHYVKVVENLDFIRDFNKIIYSEKFILVPIGSTIIHTIFFYIIDSYAFVLCEFIFIFIFMLTIFKILTLININNFFSLSLSFLIVSLSNLIENNPIDLVSHFNEIFFNLRFPRPLVTQTYYFLSLYLILKIFLNKDFFNKKYIYSLSIILGLIFSSSFFNFFSLFICFLICFVFSYRANSLLKLFENKKLYINSIIIFSIFISPFLYLLAFNSEDYSLRMGIINLDLEKKIFLINYYFTSLISLKTLCAIIFIFVVYFLIKKKIDLNRSKIQIFLIINIISSIISPILFIILSNKISFINHFNNLILLNVLILISYLFIILLDQIALIKLKTNIIKGLSAVLIFFVLFLNISIVNSKYDEEYIVKRNQKGVALNYINKNINKNCRILTFDNAVMTWLIMKEYKYIDYINGTFTTRPNKILENNLMSALKILEYDISDLNLLLESKFDGWRLKNSFAQQLFWQTYQANSFYTFNSSQNFSIDELEIIKKTKPSIIHQFAIPIEEKSRLLNLFENYEMDLIDIPNFVLINTKNKFWNKYKKLSDKSKLVNKEGSWLLFKFNNNC